MTVERALRGIAGFFVLAGVALAFLHDPAWMYFLVLVGVMLLQSAATDWCPIKWALEKTSLPRSGPAPGGGTDPAAGDCL